MIAPGTEVRPPRITTGSAFSATSDSENCTPELAAPDDAGDQRDEAGDAPDDDPDAVQRDADGLRRLVVVGHRAQRAARSTVFWKNRLSSATSSRGDQLRRRGLPC